MPFKNHYAIIAKIILLSVPILFGLFFSRFSISKKLAEESSSSIPSISNESKDSIPYAENEIREALHPLKEFTSEPTDLDLGYPSEANPMLFQISVAGTKDTLKVEGYVADLYAPQKKKAVHWPERYHYLIDFLSKFIVVKPEDGGFSLRSSFVYTTDFHHGKCPKDWRKVRLTKGVTKCVHSTELPIIGFETADKQKSKPSISAKTNILMDSDKKDGFKKKVKYFSNRIELDSAIKYLGCKESDPSNWIYFGGQNEQSIYCFGVKDDRSDFIYNVYKARYEEGNYLYYVATEKKRNRNFACQKDEAFYVVDTLQMKIVTNRIFKQQDPDHCYLYERNEDISDVCNKNWRPYRFIAPYADSSAQIEVYCYYKIPEPTIQF